jgi:hypothetical protein
MARLWLGPFAFLVSCAAAFPDNSAKTDTFAAIAGATLLRPGSVAPHVSCDAGLQNSSGQAGTLANWTTLLNGGSGWAVVNFSFANPGFGTSFSTDSKYQEIDLVANGFSPGTLDTAPTVYFGERFLKRMDVTGINYYLRVEIRNAAHAAMQTYNSGMLNAVPGMGADVVYPLTSSFSGYGAGMRFIYVEDGGYDTMSWAGQFGPYLHSAYVRLSNACGLPY